MRERRPFFMWVLLILIGRLGLAGVFCLGALCAAAVGAAGFL